MMCGVLVHTIIEICGTGGASPSMKFSKDTMADTTKVLIVLILVLETLTSLPEVYARPGIYEPATTDKPKGCFFSDAVDELCQQCAKHTKSSIVYPLCCNDQEDAQSFCRAYLDFGL